MYFRTKLKKFVIRLIRWFEGTTDEAYTDDPPVIVMGYTRSGTSMLSKMVVAAGVRFGGKQMLRPGDRNNPHGYFEHSRIVQLTTDYYEEAQLEKNMPLGQQDSLRANGILRKLRRVFTRRAMRRELARLAIGGGLWGFKMFPISFFVWNQFLPKVRIVGIYREPFANVDSCLRKWPSNRTFVQTMLAWDKVNRNMLYLLAAHESVLVSYDDLLDPKRQRRVCEQLVSFLGQGRVEELMKVVDQSRNRSSRVARALATTYPLDRAVQDTYQALQAVSGSLREGKEGR